MTREEAIKEITNWQIYLQQKAKPRDIRSRSMMEALAIALKDMEAMKALDDKTKP